MLKAIRNYTEHSDLKPVDDRKARFTGQQLVNLARNGTVTLLVCEVDKTGNIKAYH